MSNEEEKDIVKLHVEALLRTFLNDFRGHKTRADFVAFMAGYFRLDDALIGRLERE